MNKWLVAVCAGRWQMHGISAAMKAGLNVLAVDGDPGAPGLAIATKGAVADVRNPDAVIAAVEGSGIEPDGAVAFAAEAGMVAAAALRARFSLPGPGPDVVAGLTNKLIQRRAWDKAGLPNPRWKSGASAQDLLDAVDEIGLPAIVKPCDSAGSRGVSRVDPGDLLPPVVDRALKASPSNCAIVESVLSGTEHTIESFSINGTCHVLAVTSKRKVPDSKGTVAFELATVDYPPPLMKRIADVTAAALEALGYGTGPAHTEMMIDDRGQIGLVETAGRGGGFTVFDLLVPMASGYDIARATALVAVGEPAPPIVVRANAVCLRFIPSRPGRVTAIRGFDQANELSGVIATPMVSPGHVATSASTDADRLGYILAQSPSRTAALALADRAEDLIRFEIED
jgi:biotin carboxylase